MPLFKKIVPTVLLIFSILLGLFSLSGCGGGRGSSSVTASEKAGFSLVSYVPVNGVAEIVATSPNGMLLVYTNASAGEIGLVDMTDPTKPKVQPGLSVRINGVGEPTSVAITPDGKYAVVTVRMGDSFLNANTGRLRVYDISNSAAVKHVKDVVVGIGPDSIALVGEGTRLRAALAIEDEETNTKGDATVPGVRAGRIEVVGLQDLYGGVSTGVQPLELVAALTAAGGNYPTDPQPEFVSVNTTTNKAVVSLQENNAIAIVDLSDVAQPKLERVFSTGTVIRTASADLTQDAEVKLTENFSGRREGDGVAWVGDLIATANEGDTDKDALGVFGGARGFTLMTTAGNIIYESGEKSEQNAVLYGSYPDSRSAKKGAEIEGVAAAIYGGVPFLFVGSERGSFIEVYRVEDTKAPKLVQVLPTGLAPEGLATITGRADGQQLLVAANEKEGSLTVYKFHPDSLPANAQEPQLVAKDITIPWGALSGLTTDGSMMYAVPDNAFGQSRIYRINPTEAANGRMIIDQVTMLTQPDGSPLKVDLEGVVYTPDGFWVAAEGKTVADNELIKVNRTGVVQQRVKLSAEIQALFANANTSTGFEGVAASQDQRYLYVAVQRGFDTAKPFAAVLRYDTANASWIHAFYPIDSHSKDAKKYWTGLSDITFLADGRLLLLERDKGGTEAGAETAEIKRVYSVKSTDIVAGGTLTKTLVRDLRKDFNYLHEKAEGMTLHGGDLWIVNDNDGAGWTRMLNAGKL